jgi:hypothetical protein
LIDLLLNYCEIISKPFFKDANRKTIYKILPSLIDYGYKHNWARRWGISEPLFSKEYLNLLAASNDMNSSTSVNDFSRELMLDDAFSSELMLDDAFSSELILDNNVLNEWLMNADGSNELMQESREFE